MSIIKYNVVTSSLICLTAISISTTGCSKNSTHAAQLQITGFDKPPSAELLNSLDNGSNAWDVVSAAEYFSPITNIQFDVHVDRRRLLEQLFLRVTAGTSSDDAKVTAWITYLQKRIVHPEWCPLDSAGDMVVDPLWILQRRLAQCGQVNRVAADGLSVAGYKTRLVQLTSHDNMGHVAAEVFFDNAWHYIDADCLCDGDMVRKADGQIASALEIFNDPTLLDSIAPNLELLHYNFNSEILLKYADMFRRKVWERRPYYYIKTVKSRDEERNKYFGWNHYKTVH